MKSGSHGHTNTDDRENEVIQARVRGHKMNLVRTRFIRTEHIPPGTKVHFGKW